MARGRHDIIGMNNLSMSRGHYPGVKTVNKFGRNVDVTDTEDIWDGGGIWVAPTAARVHAIVSTSTEDDAVGGSGARLVKVYGLTDWDTEESSETVSMDGQVPVNTVGSYVIIHRMIVTSDGVGGSYVNAGTITATAASDATVTAQIEIGEGRTQMAIYGVPSTQNFYLYDWYSGMNKTGGATVKVDSELRWNGDPAVRIDNGVIEGSMGLISVGTSHIQHFQNPPVCYEGPGIMHVESTPSVIASDISAGFNGVLIDN